MSNAKSIKGTQTEKNLVIAYLAESSAFTRYMFYAKQAGKENYFPVERVFYSTAQNEMHHAKVFFKFLEGGSVQVPMNADAGVIGKTVDNLATAAAEELAEGVDLYTNAAKVAREEGFDEIASHFEAIATVEAMHHRRFVENRQRILDGTLWKREKPIRWQCMVCGYVYEGTEPPKSCPGCDHPYQHYIPLDEEIEVEPAV